MGDLKTSQETSEEETIARRGMVSALGALEKQISERKTEKFFVKELNHTLIQRAF